MNLVLMQVRRTINLFINIKQEKMKTNIGGYTAELR